MTKLNMFLGLISGIILFAMMIVEGIDVIGRYIVGVPVPGSAEIIEVGLGLMVFAALPLVTQLGEHVTVDLIQNSRRRAWQRVQVSFTRALSAILLGAMALQIAFRARDFAAYGDTTSYLGIPVAPIGWFMATMAALCALIALRGAYAAIADGDPTVARR